MRSKKALYNIISNFLLEIVVLISGFIVPKVIISTFGSEINGLVSSITQFLAYITLLESGFGPVVKAALYKPIAKKDNKTICDILRTSERFFRIIALVFLVYIAILCIVYPQISNNDFGWGFTASLIAIIGISTFAEYFFGITYSLYLQAKQMKYIFSIVKIATYILSTIAVVLLARFGAGIHVIKLVSGVIFIIRPLVLNFYVKKKFKIKLSNGSKGYKLEKKWDGLAQHIAYVIHTKTDITVLTIFTTLAEVSVYSVYCLAVNGVKAIIGIFSNSVDATFGDMVAKNEKKNLNEKFSVFETFNNTISTIVFASTIVLITPFVAIYTHGVSDVDYIRPLFGALLVLSEYIFIVRQPYKILIFAVGHFKETRKGAWVECATNIIVSVVLVKWLGIIGVAIGTIVAMTIRTIEFICYTNKHILERPIWKSVKKIIIMALEMIIIVSIAQLLPFQDATSYLGWGINAFITCLMATIITIGLNVVFFREDLKNIKKSFRSILRRKNKKHDIDVIEENSFEN